MSRVAHALPVYAADLLLPAGLVWRKGLGFPYLKESRYHPSAQSRKRFIQTGRLVL